MFRCHTEGMAHPYWPLFDLRIRTPRLELRLATDEDLYRLVALIDEGIHDPSTMPFFVPWTDGPPERRQRECLRWWWSKRATWRPDEWTFTAVVLADGEPVGSQDLLAKSFSQLRTVETGSWLGRAHQGLGLGKEMRAAILHLAFDELGAVEAYSRAFEDNAASLGTSRAMGYSLNGRHRELQRDQPAMTVDLRLDRATWVAHRRDDIEVIGLERCREMFGLPTSGGV